MVSTVPLGARPVRLFTRRPPAVPGREEAEAPAAGAQSPLHRVFVALALGFVTDMIVTASGA